MKALDEWRDAVFQSRMLAVTAALWGKYDFIGADLSATEVMTPRAFGNVMGSTI